MILICNHNCKSLIALALSISTPTSAFDFHGCTVDIFITLQFCIQYQNVFFSPTPNSSLKPAGGATIQLSSETIYLEIASDRVSAQPHKTAFASEANHKTRLSPVLPMGWL